MNGDPDAQTSNPHAQQLRSLAVLTPGLTGMAEDLRGAADEIERLTSDRDSWCDQASQRVADLDAMRIVAEDWHRVADERAAEIERLSRCAAEVEMMALTLEAREKEIERLERDNATLRSVCALWGLSPDPDDSLNIAKRGARETEKNDG